MKYLPPKTENPCLLTFVFHRKEKKRKRKVLSLHGLHSLRLLHGLQSAESVFLG